MTPERLDSINLRVLKNRHSPDLAELVEELVAALRPHVRNHGDPVKNPDETHAVGSAETSALPSDAVVPAPLVPDFSPSTPADAAVFTGHGGSPDGDLDIGEGSKPTPPEAPAAKHKAHDKKAHK